MDVKKKKITKEEIKKIEIKKTLSILLSGVFLIIGFVAINGANYTGFSVLSKNSFSTPDFLGLVIIFTSLTLIIIGGIRLRKINEKRE